MRDESNENMSQIANLRQNSFSEQARSHNLCTFGVPTKIIKLVFCPAVSSEKCWSKTKGNYELYYTSRASITEDNGWPDL